MVTATQADNPIDSIDIALPNVQALACMRLTNPDVEAAYPMDAEEHFAEADGNQAFLLGRFITDRGSIS